MSVLDRFIRIRRYRGRATEYRELASGAFAPSVRDRFLMVADHYNALAALEVRSDQTTRSERLAQLRLEREQRQV